MRFKTEKDSIDYFVGRLKAKGWTDIVTTQAIDPMCYYDIQATWAKTGMTCRFELKRRNCKSTTFGDCIFGADKYNKMMKAIANKEVDRCMLVLLFEDKIAFADITKPDHFGNINCYQTTELDKNNKRIERVWVFYNKPLVLDYEY